MAASLGQVKPNLLDSKQLLPEDQKGIIKLADALQENKSLRVLMLSKNGITAQAGFNQPDLEKMFHSDLAGIYRFCI